MPAKPLVYGLAMRVWNRREFLRLGASSLVALQAHGAVDAQARFEPWQAGWLDVHHISTGRGNSMLAVLPDGTSLMVDAGAVDETGDARALAAARPDGSRRPGEWIARYAARQLAATPAKQIDTFVLSHFHGDHMGQLTARSPQSKLGDYKLTGVSDVAETLPIRRVLDRGFPDYAYPGPINDPSTLNYRSFLTAQQARGMKVERFRAGASTQIQLEREASRYPAFRVRNLASNGEVWTGEGERTRSLFPPLDSLARAQWPPENPCSNALRIEYGGFRYYIGGDLTWDTRFGSQPWMDVESAVAKVAGPVSAASLDHHGYYDSTGEAFVRAMQARIYVLQSWHASHPAFDALDRIYSPVLEPGKHDVLATDLVEAAEIVESRLSDRMLSQQGHVVIRVEPGGARYWAYVLDHSDESDRVKARFGPFASGASGA